MRRDFRISSSLQKWATVLLRWFRLNKASVRMGGKRVAVEGKRINAEGKERENRKEIERGIEREKGNSIGEF